MKRCILLVWAFLLVCAPGATAQTVAELSGRVTDETGGSLPGVTVTAVQTATALTRDVVTNARGEYLFTNLPVGPYKLAARLQGFSVFEQSGIVLAVGESRAVNVTLKVGAMSETVSVQADATLVESRDVGIGRLVEKEQLVGLPLDGRNVLQLVLLAGNAVQGNDVTAGNNRNYPGGIAVSVAGGTANSTNYQVDGGYNNDPQNNSGNAMPFPEALQEFSVETGVRSARYGQSTGATVSAVTRSGTNEFSGSLFGFVRHHKFNAIQYFERTASGGLGRDDGLKRGQTGGTFGGPIVKDKLFFFAGVQVTNTRVANLRSGDIVPTAEVRRGDFRRFMSAACRGTNRTLGAPFVNNQIDPALFHPISLRLMTLLPLPDPALDPDGCGRYVIAQPDNSDDQQYVGRVDYQASSKHRFFGRLFYSKYYQAPLFDIETAPNLILGSGTGGGNDARMRTLATGWDWVVSPTLFSSARIAYQHTATYRIQGRGMPTWQSLGVKTFQYTQGGGQDFLGGGTAGWGGNALTGTFFVSTPSITQDFDWIRGSHTISFGGSWARPYLDADGTVRSNGDVTFNGIFTSGTAQTTGGHAMADFVLGLPSTFGISGSQLNKQRLHSVGLYVQDVWRMNRRLTLNYGIRWEPYLSPIDDNGWVLHFSRDRFNQGLRSQVYPNAPAGLVFPGDAGFDYLADRKHHRDDWNKWAPRFGLVWDPKGDTQQTIRVGVGHYYDAPQLWSFANQSTSAPYGMRAEAIAPSSCAIPNRNGCAIVLDDPWRFTPGGDPVAGRGRMGDPVTPIPTNSVFPRLGQFKSTPSDVETMQVTQWNLAFERQLPLRMMVDVTYIGSRTRNAWLGYEENPIIYIPGNCVAGQYGLTAPGPCSNTQTNNRNARSLLTLIDPVSGPFYANWNLVQLYPEGDGRYHGLRVGVQKRMGDGWSVNSNYTRSTCTNEGEPNQNITNLFPVPLRDPYNDPAPDDASNEGPCAADRPHLFNLSTVLISPGVGGGWLRTLTHDWQVGLIFQARSGSSLTPAPGADFALTNGPQRPVLVAGVDPYLPESERTWANNNTALRWFNMAAFAPNTAGDWGNVSRGYLRAPGFQKVDASFSRNINVGQGRRVEVRIEAFNLFDTVNWGSPNVTLNSNTSGMITSTDGDPRIMQFALKYSF